MSFSTERVFAALARASAWLLPAVLAVAALGARAEDCTGPPQLQARLQAHPDAETYTALGDWFINNHQDNCAIKSFQAARKLDAASKSALDGLARELLARGDDQAVIQRLRSVARDQALTLDLATAYKKAGQFDDAEAVLAEGLKSAPRSDALTAALIPLYLRESHFEAATALAEKIAHLNPNDIEAQRIYLRTLVNTGENEAALPLGRKLLTLAPRDADLLNLNGFLERKAGEYAAARKHLEAAIAIDPNDYNSRVNLGLVLAQLQENAGAKAQLEKAIELGALEPQVRFELAKVLRALGQTEAAQRQLELYRQKLKQESDESLAVLKSTEAAQADKDGDKQKAADLYREACAAQPENAAFSYRLAVVLGESGDEAGQRAALLQAVKINPKFVRAQYDLGYLEFRGGNHSAAEEHFRAVVKAAPENAQAWLSLAATLASESRFDEARAAVSNALQLDPNHAGALALSKKLAERGNSQ